VLPLWDRVDGEVRSDATTEATLAEWGRALSAVPDQPEFHLRLVEAGETDESQRAIWRAVDSVVGEGDEVLLDITHGFRHLPVLTAFMVMLLRWTKRVRGVDLYYGALEMRRENEAGVPVLRLPLCNELLAVTEAAATYRTTGDVALLADRSPLDDHTRTLIRQITFCEETHQFVSGKVREALAALRQADLPPPYDAARPLLHEALAWGEGVHLVARLQQRMDAAFRYRDYFKATGLLWEAVRIAAARLYPDLKTRDPADYQVREEAERRLKEGKPEILAPGEHELLRDIEDLRNAVMHGTRPQRACSQRALGSEEEFRNFFEQGRELLAKLAHRAA